MNKKIQLLDITANQIKHLYLEENKTKEEVSKALNITMYSLSNYFKNYNIKKSMVLMLLLLQKRVKKRF